MNMFNVLFGLAACLCVTPSVCEGDQEEWEQQSVWLSELLSGLDKVDVYMEQLQQDQEKWITQGGDWATSLHALVSLMPLWFVSGLVDLFLIDMRFQMFKKKRSGPPGLAYIWPKCGCYPLVVTDAPVFVHMYICIWARYGPLNRIEKRKTNMGPKYGLDCFVPSSLSRQLWKMPTVTLLSKTK